MDLSNVFGGNKEKLTWGSAIALWDIARLKIVGLPMLNIFEAAAKDTELKSLISLATNKQIIPQIKKIKEFFGKRGVDLS